MATLTISLPEASTAWLDERVRSGEYTTASDYVRSLIERDRDERQLSQEELGRLLDDADSGGLSDRSVDEIAAAAWSRRAG
ncbi:ribbon-helix-helix domain-containing protein [Enterovirga sp. CN4-39]|uniref:ribbon-helix-helix domain-containing protein n=1 Tax=Enterovirga sp. CN4-39 TaxID=3400910 RepID=UPI003C00ED4F